MEQGKGELCSRAESKDTELKMKIRYLLEVFSFIYMTATQKTFFSVSDYRS